MSRPVLEVKAVGVTFASHNSSSVVALLDTSLSVGEHELLCIIGPSGCGKSTLLLTMCGLLQPTTGAVLLNSAPLREPSQRVGLIFQHHTLFPWLSIEGNIQFALKATVPYKNERRTIAAELLEQVGLGDFAELHPEELSGGMTQRAALARAIAARPGVLLLDEPFGALDAVSRLDMQSVLLEVWKKKNLTIVFVTHDLDEAVTLGDRIIVLSRRPAQVINSFDIELPRPRIERGVRCRGFEDVRNRVAAGAGEVFGAHGTASPTPQMRARRKSS